MVIIQMSLPLYINFLSLYKKIEFQVPLFACNCAMSRAMMPWLQRSLFFLVLGCQVVAGSNKVFSLALGYYLRMRWVSFTKGLAVSRNHIYLHHLSVRLSHHNQLTVDLNQKTHIRKQSSVFIKGNKKKSPVSLKEKKDRKKKRIRIPLQPILHKQVFHASGV